MNPSYSRLRLAPSNQAVRGLPTGLSLSGSPEASGMPKRRIEECAARQQAHIDSGSQVIIGVNKFTTKEGSKEGTIAVRQIDNADVLVKQKARLAAVRASREPSKIRDALAALEAAARAPADAVGPNGKRLSLTALAVAAARARATLGEISSALEAAWGRHEVAASVSAGAYISEKGGPKAEAEVADVLAAVRGFEAREGRRPRILIAKMGQDGHDRGARVMATGLADLGWDVDISPLFQTPAEVANAAVDADVHVVGVSSQAAGHRVLVPELMRELAARGAGHVLVVAGGIIPPQDHEALKAVGVTAIYGPGTRIPAAAADMLARIAQARPSGK